MPSPARSLAGPTPERSRIAGLPYDPRGEDHLAGGNLGAARRDHADRLPGFEPHPVDEHTARDLEVGAAADLLGEVDESVVLAHAVDDIDRVGADSGRVRAVEVVDAPEALGRGRVDEPAQRGGQIVVAVVADGERSRAPVIRVVAVRRVLHLPVGLVDAIDRPVVKAMALPVEDVARPCPHRHRRVVGRAAAERLAARGVDARRGGSAAGGEAPFVLWRGRHTRGVEQIHRIAVDAVRRAGLEQQDRMGRILAQTGGEDGARGASAHDDDVRATGAAVADIGHEPDARRRAGDASSPNPGDSAATRACRDRLRAVGAAAHHRV
jgi:hypothetical protein